jgi:hypothetical protein
VVDGDDFHRAANLIHPDFSVADHDALITDEQIVRFGGGDRRRDWSIATMSIVGVVTFTIWVPRRVLSSPEMSGVLQRPSYPISFYGCLT